MPVGQIPKLRPFFRVSMATVVTRTTPRNDLISHHLDPTLLSFDNQMWLYWEYLKEVMNNKPKVAKLDGMAKLPHSTVYSVHNMSYV